MDSREWPREVMMLTFLASSSSLRASAKENQLGPCQEDFGLILGRLLQLFQEPVVPVGAVVEVAEGAVLSGADLVVAEGDALELGPAGRSARR